MSDQTIQFTSDFVCENLARKVVLSYGRTTLAKSAEAINDRYVVPLMTRMINSGKLKRGMVIKEGRRLGATIAALPPVVACSIAQDHKSSLSTREIIRLSYVMAVSGTSSDFVDFVASETFLTRRLMELSQTTLDLKVHRHALARFMGRELQSAEAMLRDMEQAHHMAYLVSGIMQVQGHNGEIALPIGADAMIYGRVEAVGQKKRRISRMRITQDKPEMWDDTREEVAIDLPPVAVKIMTYLDANSLTPPRLALRDILIDFRNRHASALADIFGISHYPNYPLVNLQETDPEFEQKVAPLVAAIAELKTILGSSEWRQFTQRNS